MPTLTNIVRKFVSGLQGADVDERVGWADEHGGAMEAENRLRARRGG